MHDVTITRRGHMLRVEAHSLSLFWPTRIPHSDAMLFALIPSLLSSTTTTIFVQVLLPTSPSDSKTGTSPLRKLLEFKVSLERRPHTAAIQPHLTVSCRCTCFQASCQRLPHHMAFNQVRPENLMDLLKCVHSSFSAGPHIRASGEREILRPWGSHGLFDKHLCVASLPFPEGKILVQIAQCATPSNHQLRTEAATVERCCCCLEHTTGELPSYRECVTLRQQLFLSNHSLWHVESFQGRR